MSGMPVACRMLSIDKVSLLLNSNRIEAWCTDTVNSLRPPLKDAYSTSNQKTICIVRTISTAFKETDQSYPHVDGAQVSDPRELSSRIDAYIELVELFVASLQLRGLVVAAGGLFYGPVPHGQHVHIHRHSCGTARVEYVMHGATR